MSEQVCEQVRRLGEMQPGAIARMLIAEGIKGTTGDADRCPVARYLSRYVIDGHIVSVSRRRVLVTVPRTSHINRIIADVDTPENLSFFIEMFDVGKYPRLVESTRDVI